MKHRAAAVVLALAGIPALAHAQPVASAVVRYDASVEVSSAVYQMSTVVEALKVEHSAENRGKDSRIRHLEGQLRTAQAGSAESQRLAEELSRLQREVVDQLAQKDAELSRQVAAFRGELMDIASTPEGIEIIRLFNAGDWAAADLRFDQIIAATDRAADLAAKIQKAAPRRQRATLALEARKQGKATTQLAIERYEEVVAIDGAHWDWIELGRLYHDVGDLDKATFADSSALAAATDQRDQIVSLLAMASTQTHRGELASAKATTLDALDIARQSFEREESSRWQQATWAAYQRMGVLLADDGDERSALEYFRLAMSLAQEMLAGDSSNQTWRNMLAISYADLAMRERDERTSERWGRKALELHEALLAESPHNLTWLLSVSSDHRLLADVLAIIDNKSARLHAEESREAWNRAEASAQGASLSLAEDWLALSEVDSKIEWFAGNRLRASLHAYTALRFAEDMVARFPGSATWRDNLIRTKELFAYRIVWGGNNADVDQMAYAMPLFEEVLNARKQLVAADSDIASRQWALARSYEKVGSVLEEYGDIGSARQYYQLTFDVAQSMVSRQPTNKSWNERLSAANSNLVRMKWLQSMLDDSALKDDE